MLCVFVFQSTSSTHETDLFSFSLELLDSKFVLAVLKIKLLVSRLMAKSLRTFQGAGGGYLGLLMWWVSCGLVLKQQQKLNQ